MDKNSPLRMNWKEQAVTCVADPSVMFSLFAGVVSADSNVQSLFEKQLSNVSEVDTELNHCVGNLRDTMVDIIRKKRHQETS